MGVRYLLDTHAFLWLLGTPELVPAQVRDDLARPESELPVSTEHALLAGSLDWQHRDPFDRLLVAQALVENLTMITSDAQIAAVTGLRVRW